MPFTAEHLAWFVLWPPLASAAAILGFALRRRTVSAGLSISAVLLSFAASLVLLLRDVSGHTGLTWLSLSDGQASFIIGLGLKLDPLSTLMAVVVTGVGALIHLYSYGYLHEDPDLGRYYAGLSLFMFAMLGIVLADNLLLMFVFWELVGVSSYLLIGFWRERSAAADAAKKAFLTNRVGDFGFLLGIILVWSLVGTLDFAALEQRLRANPAALGSWATTAGLLLFCGAVGKSAQFPLHVWLPDAMEGPTPVSALIHAATMVAAGVYMLCRIFFLLAVPGSQALVVMGWVGAVTALLAALIALQQDDIKRILAYSTLSQLGYMVLAVGASGAEGNPAPAMHHLAAHAFFKALLFLGAGSVIHVLHHEQDIWHMGALSRRMPVTFWTFLLATLALSGVPPLSGFFSKDEILAVALQANVAWFGIAVFVAFLTPLYMFRLVLVAFLGPAKSQAPDHARESPAVMTVPLVVLAVPTVLAGFWGLGLAFGRQYGGTSSGAGGGGWATLVYPFAHAPVAAWGGLLAALLGLGTALACYRHAIQDPLPAKLGALAGWMRARFYLDELYARIIAWTQEALATLADWVDRWVLAGAVIKGTHGSVELAGRLLRLIQTGNLQTYALWFAAGVAVLLIAVLTR